MGKRKRITKRDHQRILNESLIDPNDENPFQIILTMNDPAYMESKAIELIHEARHGSYHEKIRQAVTLLSLARAYRGPAPEKNG